MLKTNLKIIILVLLVVIGLFSVLKVYMLIKRVKINKQSISTAQKLIMGSATFSGSDNKILFPYPIVQSGLTSEQTQTFNDFTRKFAEKVYNSQKGEMPSQWDGSVVVERADSKIVSVRMQAVQYFGGAHPNTTNYVINYSVENSKEITFDDMFKKDDKSLNTLSALVKSKIIKEFKKDGVDTVNIESMIEDGTKPNSQSFQKFVIGDFYITFIYDQYEVAPYSYGMRLATISFDELENLLKVDFKN